MNCKLLVAAWITSLATMPIVAAAEEADCLSICTDPGNAVRDSAAGAPPRIDLKLDTVKVVVERDAIDGKTVLSCDDGLIKKADALNNSIKPIRELVGYVRSPQGLAIKLVNDHVVKIPAWVGYVMDPAGSIKRRAFDEVRTRAREAYEEDHACSTAPISDSVIPVIDLYVGHTV